MERKRTPSARQRKAGWAALVNETDVATELPSKADALAAATRRIEAMAAGRRWLQEAGFLYDPRTMSWMPNGLPDLWVREDDVEWVVCGRRVGGALLLARVALEARRIQRDHEAAAEIAAAIAERGEA